MLYGKLRIHTCRVILLTSLVWFLVDVIILSYYSECLGSACKQNEHEPEAAFLANNEDLQGRSADLADNRLAPSPPKR